MRETTSTTPAIRIAPAVPWPWPTRSDVVELWQYRALLGQLVRRDVRVRYAQTLLGAAWAVLQPVVSMAIFTLIFGFVARVPSGEAPYALMALAGLVPWTYFATVVAASSDSLLTNRDLVTRIYFPRLIIPLAPILAGLVDLAIGLMVLLGAVLLWGPAPIDASVLLLPLPFVVMIITASGVGIWATALNIQYRDVRYVIPFALQTGLFLSPVIYPLDIVPDRFHILAAVNPMTGVIETVRASFLGGPVPWTVLGVSAASAVTLFAAGTAYFRRAEQLFADIA